MLYFTSDFHLYHENILRLSPRVRFKGFEVVILRNLCSLSEEDTLYVLGDFTWHLRDHKGYLELWRRLPFRKILVPGNHDRNPEKLKEYFDEVLELYHVLETPYGRILLSHYPAHDPLTGRYPEIQELIREVYFKEGCDILLHGHVHWNEEGIRCGCSLYGVKCFNVNVEWNGYRPVALGEVIEKVTYP